MGKNKQKPKKNAGSGDKIKNVKLKTKAKPVNTQLKRINVQNKSKIVEMDKQLVELQDKIRKGSKKEVKSANTSKLKPLKGKTEKEYLHLQKKSQEALEDLNQMQLS